GLPTAGQVLISEFRFRGSAGGNDEFVELYNNTDSPITVAASDASTGWALVGANTAAAPSISARFVIPNGTIIPARGHYLGTNNGAAGYSLGGYATGDVTYATGVVDGDSIGLFNNNTAANWTAANRLDAVGFTAPVGDTASFIEGSGLTPAGGITTNGEYTLMRKLTSGLPQDSDNNANDFVFVSTTGTTISTLASTLGAPGPESSTSPILRNAQIKASLIDPGCNATAVNPASPTACVRERVTTPVTNGTLGTLSIRRKFTNNTGAPVTRLRFRVVDITTLTGGVAPAGAADLRVVTSVDIPSAALSGGGTTTISGLTLETPPTQAIGGGLNSSLAVGTITVGTPLGPGASINVQFLLGVQTGGTYRFFINVEALP